MHALPSSYNKIVYQNTSIRLTARSETIYIACVAASSRWPNVCLRNGRNLHALLVTRVVQLSYAISGNRTSEITHEAERVMVWIIDIVYKKCHWNTI